MRSILPNLTDRIRSRFGQRASGIVLALLVELLVALLLFTLGPEVVEEGPPQSSLVTFDAPPDADPAPDPSENDEAADSPAEPRDAQPPPAEAQVQPSETPEPAEQKPEAAPPPWIELTRDQMAAADLSRTPPPAAVPAAPAPPSKVYGPVADSRYAVNASDTPRVPGSGPNGEPLYAAAWYREPYHDELSGFLSAAKGPGWGLIACRTAPRYHVEDCVKVAEYPANSGIARAVLLAAFQFRVRPPRIGGEPQVGAWVQIRIDYGMEP